MSDNERTLIIVKPHAVKRHLVGEIVGRFEKRGYKLLAMNMGHADETTLKSHYEDLQESEYFPLIIQGMMTGPVVVFVLSGPNVVSVARKMIGTTDPTNADPSTIRGTYAVDIGRNVVHASDSIENAEREIALWFPDGVSSWVSEVDPLVVRQS